MQTSYGASPLLSALLKESHCSRLPGATTESAIHQHRTVDRRLCGAGIARVHRDPREKIPPLRLTSTIAELVVDSDPFFCSASRALNFAARQFDSGELKPGTGLARPVSNILV